MDFMYRWIFFVLGAIYAQLMDIVGIFFVFLLVFVVDAITGVSASLHENKTIESNKLRWSFVKTLCYLGTFAITIFLGAALLQIDFFVYVLKCEVYVALWIELLSITENMKRIFPGVSLWSYLHYMMAFEWCKRISGMSDFLKQNKNEDSSRTNSED